MTDAPVVVFDPAKDATFDPAQRSLQENEEVIRAGLGTFVEVGRALLDIRDSGQYREAGFDNFDLYCRERWGLGRRWAERQMSSSRVVAALNVYDHIPQLPENPEQALPLVPLLNSHGEEAVRNAWDQIVNAHQGDGAITGREIRAFLNPVSGVPPSQRSVSDAYLSALDKLEAAIKAARWAIGKGEGKGVPKPVAERYAEHILAARELISAVEAIAAGETPELMETNR